MNRFLFKLASSGLIILLPLALLTTFSSKLCDYEHLGVPHIPTVRHPFTKLKITEWEEIEQKPPCLFFGSSTGMYALHTPTLLSHGISSFSFCTQSQTVENSKDLINYSHQNPTKTVVIDIYPDLWHRPTFSIETGIDWILSSNIESFRKVKHTLITTARAVFKEKIALLLFLQQTLLSPWNRHEPKTTSNDGVSKYNSLGSVSKIDFQARENPCPTSLKRSFSSQISTITSIKTLVEHQGGILILHLPPTLCDYEIDTIGISEFNLIDGTKWHGHQNQNYFDHDDHLLSDASIEYTNWLAPRVYQKSHYALQQP